MYRLVFESLCLVRMVWWGVVWPYRPFLGSVSTWTVDMYAAAAAASRGRWQYLAPERGAFSAENNCIIQVFSLSDQIHAAGENTYISWLPMKITNQQKRMWGIFCILHKRRLQGRNCACTDMSGDCGNKTLFFQLLAPQVLLKVPRTYDNHPTTHSIQHMALNELNRS